MVSVKSSSPKFYLDSPKSVNFNVPMSSMRMFSGLRSLYRMSCLCRCSTASSTSQNRSLAWDGVKLRCF